MLKIEWKKCFIVVLAAFLGMGICPSHAREIIVFGPREAKIEGAIPYSVIGKYNARFGIFTGQIMLDDDLQKIRSVDLEIEAGSIRSNHPWYDKIARSRRLLYVSRYPKIIFKSDKIIHDESGYKVKGILVMHGIKKKMIFPFKVGITIDQNSKREIFDLKGTWIINRKDFNIIWNKYLDRGGVLVGDFLTVDWAVRVSTYLPNLN